MHLYMFIICKLNISENLNLMFEPVTGPLSIVYANGQEWADRKKWLYGTLQGTILESYIPIFTKVNVASYFKVVLAIVYLY